MKRLITALALLLAATAAKADGGHVFDAIDLIPAGTEENIEKALAEVETTRGQRIDVVLIQFKNDVFQGGVHFDAVDPATDALEPRRKPNGKPNDNVMLVISPGDTNVLIAIGNGFPKAYQALGDEIVKTQIIPKFIEGDLTGGVVAGVDAILSKMRLDVTP